MMNVVRRPRPSWSRTPHPSVPLLIALVVGCGSSLPPAATPDQAREALETALDAWKGGGTPDALANGDIAIRMVDRDWQEGRALMDYELTGPALELGLNVQCPVKLTLSGPAGKPVEKRLNYVISPGKPLVITRLEADF